MLIKFTGGGRGGGRQVAEYLTREEGRGHAPPEVVRGDMDRTRDLIDSIDRQWTYTHGVLSFAAEDAPTEDQQREAMDMFERLAFAGLDHEQYDITWVRHSHTESRRTELHFVTPRMELNSGKALNIAPPNWKHSYAPLRDTLNLHHGWARPDDPARAQELTQAPERALEGFRLREGREGIHEYLTALVASESVTDRTSMVQAIREAGLEVTREGKDYLTVQDPTNDERFRMKGRIYEKDWTYDRELDRAIATAVVQSDGRDRGIDLGRADAAREQLEATVRSRAAHHAERYPRHEYDDGRRAGDHALDRALVVGGADRDLAGDRGLLSLALDAAGDRDRAVRDLHGERANVSTSSRGDRTDDLQQSGGHRAASVRGPADEGLEHGQADTLRAGVARAIRNAGERIRDLTESVRSHIAAVADLVRDRSKTPGLDRAEAARDRAFSNAVVAVLELAQRANHELGAAGERASGRVAEITRQRELAEQQERVREQEAHDQRQRIRERDRGDDHDYGR